MINVNDKLTIFAVNFMGITSRSEIVIAKFLVGKPVFKQKGKRKEYYLDINEKTAIFKGWDIPIHCDSEGGSFRGNACLNFIGSKEEIKNFIDFNNINEILDKSIILAVSQTVGKGAKEVVVYPDQVIPGSHAVIDRVLQSEKVVA